MKIVVTGVYVDNHDEVLRFHTDVLGFLTGFASTHKIVGDRPGDGRPAT